MTLRTALTLSFLLCAALPTGCVVEGDDDDSAAAECSAPYQPFEAGNYQNQLLRVGAYTQIVAIRKAEDFSSADFVTIEDLYINTADLQSKVQGRGDDHDYAEAGSIGDTLDGEIVAAIAAGKADDAIKVQGQIIDKTLQRFFYLSVFHEMMKSQAAAAAAPDVEAGWDEGFGYFGVANDGADQSGIAATLGKRDLEFGVTLVSDVFNGLVDGRCLVADVDYAGLVPIIDDVDISMLRGFALSVVHEMDEYSDDPLIKGWEGLLYWRIIAPYIDDADPTSYDAGEAEWALGVENIDTDIVRAAVTDSFGFDL
jgi:hypothetical protein